jgi:hypothetical protein
VPVTRALPAQLGRLHDRDSDLFFVVLSNIESDAAILHACDLLQLAIDPSAPVDAAARSALEPAGPVWPRPRAQLTRP